MQPVSAPASDFGLGFSVVTDLADSQALGSEGIYGWSGIYGTNFWVDPKEKLVADHDGAALSRRAGGRRLPDADLSVARRTAGAGSRHVPATAPRTARRRPSPERRRSGRRACREAGVTLVLDSGLKARSLRICPSPQLMRQPVHDVVHAQLVGFVGLVDGRKPRADHSQNCDTSVL